MLIYYDFFQSVAIFHHWSFTTSPDNSVGQGSEESRDSKPLKRSWDWVSEEMSFWDETEIQRCQDTDEGPTWSWEGNSMESEWLKEILFILIVDLIKFVNFFGELFSNEICDELFSYVFGNCVNYGLPDIKLSWLM